jgi:hypothetical protein
MTFKIIYQMTFKICRLSIFIFLSIFTFNSVIYLSLSLTLDIYRRPPLPHDQRHDVQSVEEEEEEEEQEQEQEQEEEEEELNQGS